MDSEVTINVLGNDSDPDGDPRAIRSISFGQHGVVDVNDDGTITYAPDAGFNGNDSFTYTIEDGRGGVASARVNVTVVAGRSLANRSGIIYAFNVNATCSEETINADVFIQEFGKSGVIGFKAGYQVYWKDESGYWHKYAFGKWFETSSTFPDDKTPYSWRNAHTFVQLDPHSYSVVFTGSFVKSGAQDHHEHRIWYCP
jgi:hypothetical protein